MGGPNRLNGLGNSRVETEGLVHEIQIVIYGLGDADHAYIQFPPGNLFGDQFRGPHGAVAADTKKYVDVHPLQDIDDLTDVLFSPG